MNDLQVGEVTGYRLFRLDPEGLLASYSAEYAWIPGANEASCLARKRRQHGPVPAMGCGCGFWMYKDLERCARMFRGDLLASREQFHGGFGGFEPNGQAILGRCKAWGRVLEGEDGWRAEFAKVDALLDLGLDADLGRAAEVYAAPVEMVSIDLALSHRGVLTSRDDQADASHRIGIELDGSRRLLVDLDSRAFLQLWKMELGTQVEVRLDERGDVAEVRLLRSEVA
jgi:hypothetical protein